MDLTIIQRKIYEIRGQRVMLDFDLAELYQVETFNLKKAVRRNIERFPSDFMFELTQEEFKLLINNMKFQSGIPNIGGSRFAPFAFTEQGVAMLSSVLRSPIAIHVNISIMRAFVQVRKTLVNPQNQEIIEVKQEMKELKQYIEEVFSDYNDINEDTALQLELINQTLAELSAKQTAKERQTEHSKIGFRK